MLMVIWCHGLRGRLVRVPDPNGFDRFMESIAMKLWTGVDLFFVLSGFLITGVLLDTRDSPDRVRTFYGRRALRIFPLYLAYVSVLLLALPAAGFDLTPTVRGWTKAMYFVHLQNFDLAARGMHTYLAGHLWSLAVEEQFYLLWPMAAFAVAPRRLAWAAAGLAAVSVGFRWWAARAGFGPVFVYVHTAARLDCLAAGALLALAARRGGVAPAPYAAGTEGRGSGWRRWAAPAALVAGLAWIARTDMDFTRWSPAMQAGGYAVVAVTGAAALWTCLPSALPNPLRWLTERAVLRAVGKVSYAMYVFHVPLDHIGVHWLWFTRPPGGPAPMARVPVAGWCPLTAYCVGLTLVTYGAAWVSWHLLEKRCLALKRWFPYRLREPLVKGGAAA